MKIIATLLLLMSCLACGANGVMYAPLSADFTDIDPGATIGGVITVERAIDETNISAYWAHFQADREDCIGFDLAAHAGFRLDLPAPDIGFVEIPIPEGTPVPLGAVKIVVHSIYDNGIFPNIHYLAACAKIETIDNL